MNSAIERLLSLRIKDLMNRHVMAVQADESMRRAAERLREHDVTGAPVVDGTGRCVGMLSATDFVYREADSEAAPLYVKHGPCAAYLEELAGEDCVSARMSPLVQTIDAESPVLNAARMMCQEHIHRLVVVDEQQRPVGIVSTLDLVAAMIAVVEE